MASRDCTFAERDPYITENERRASGVGRRVRSTPPPRADPKAAGAPPRRRVGKSSGNHVHFSPLPFFFRFPSSGKADRRGSFESEREISRGGDFERSSSSGKHVLRGLEPRDAGRSLSTAGCQMVASSTRPEQRRWKRPRCAVATPRVRHAHARRALYPEEFLPAAPRRCGYGRTKHALAGPSVSPRRQSSTFAQENSL